MKYAFTIYGDEGQRAAASEEDQQAMSQAYGAVSQEMEEKGVLVAGEGLYPTQTATTVRFKDGNPIVTDGPFIESKEVIGGFAIVQVKDLDEALEMAKAWRAGPVEVWPAVER